MLVYCQIVNHEIIKNLKWKFFGLRKQLFIKKSAYFLISSNLAHMQIYPHAGTYFIKYAYCAIVYSK